MDNKFRDGQFRDIKNRSIKKGKQGILHIIFGRTGILLGCLLLQLLLLFFGIQFLAQYVYVFFGGYLVFGLLILIVILNRSDNPTFQVTWAALVLLFPVFGGLLYLYIEIQPGTRMLEGRLEELNRETEGLLVQDREVLRELAGQDVRMAQLAYYVGKEGFPIYKNTQVKYFPSGEKKFEELKKQLLAAKQYIFMEYFIISEGYMWDSILKILEQKVKEGVEVRVMYDGMNELYNLPYRYPDRLKGMGIRCKVFSPVYPVISTHYNNRDHRKIVIIDGYTAFTGGVNMADEYINRKRRFGHWKDAAIMLQGEAVRTFTLTFLKMWAVSEKLENPALYLKSAAEASHGTSQCARQDVEQSRNMDMSQEEAASSAREHSDVGNAQGFVMPYVENPFSNERIAERIYLEILNSACRYVHIMTPYLVPGTEMMQAMTYAAKRGIDVKLILPHIPDKKYAFALAHSYYKKLIKAGVHIYEYTPGFVHSKVFVSDDVRAVVGAINLDYRSLYLHFESAAFLCGVPEIHNIEDDFRATLPKCQLMTMFDVRHDKWLRKQAGRILKLIAPLM